MLRASASRDGPFTRSQSLQINDEDLKEAVTLTHAIGDGALRQSDESKFTQGSSEQRIRWLRRDLDGGDARQCDTFGVRNHDELGVAVQPASVVVAVGSCRTVVGRFNKKGNRLYPTKHNTPEGFLQGVVHQ